eukprot:8462913-Karenia_brevis.AAC.1
MPLPKIGQGHMSTDAASLYGFRPEHADTFYLCPWEFCQWLKTARLERPSATYDLSIWAPAGRKKLNARAYADLQPVVDYIFNNAKVKNTNGFYRLPTPAKAFQGIALA